MPRPGAASGSAPPLPSAYGFATVITLALVNHPWLLDRFAEEVATPRDQGQAACGAAQAVTSLIFEDHGMRPRAPGRAAGGKPAWQALRQASRESAFTRVHFRSAARRRRPRSKSNSPISFTVSARCRASPASLQEGADQLADVTEAEFERFAQLQQQVASVGQQHAADDAGDRDAAKRFQETVARLKQAHIGGQRGRRPERPIRGRRPACSARVATEMSEIKEQENTLSRRRCGLDRREPPRQVMLKTCKSPRDHDFWGWTRFLSPGLRAEADPREAYRWLLMIVLSGQICGSNGTLFGPLSWPLGPCSLGRVTVDPSLAPV